MKTRLTIVFSSLLLAAVLAAPAAQAQEAAAPRELPLFSWLRSLAPVNGAVENGAAAAATTKVVTAPLKDIEPKPAKPLPPAATPSAKVPSAEIKVAAVTPPKTAKGEKTGSTAPVGYAPRVYTLEDIFGTGVARPAAKPASSGEKKEVLVASAAPQAAAAAAAAKKPNQTRKKVNMKTWKSKGKNASASRKSRTRGLDPKYARTEIAYETKYSAGTIVIDTDAKFLYLVQPGGKALRYGVGVGRQGFSWKGTAKIRRKAEWPTWTPPAAMRKREPWLPARMEGGPDNPLGARAMYLYKGGKDTLYRIHGTNKPETIGKAVSSGCIRLINDAVADLYERTKMGATVVVL